MKLKMTGTLLLVSWITAHSAAGDEPHKVHPRPTNRFATMSAEESRAAIESARVWARTLAGNKPERYALELQAALLRIQAGGTPSVGATMTAAGPDEVVVVVESSEGLQLIDPAEAPEKLRDLTMTGLSPERQQELTKAAQSFTENLDASSRSTTPELLILQARLRSARGKTGGVGPVATLIPKVPPEFSVEDRARFFSLLDQDRDGPTRTDSAFTDLMRGEGGSIANGRSPAAAHENPRAELAGSSSPFPEKVGRPGRSDPNTALIRATASDPGMWLATEPFGLVDLADTRGLSPDQQSLMLVDRSSFRRRTWDSLLASDKQWRENFERWLGLRTPPYPGARMLGSQPDERDEFPYCVAISESETFRGRFGSGVLISPNVVLTAAHVIRDDLYRADPNYRQTVWIGQEAGQAGRRVKARAANCHPDYFADKANNIYKNDIGLMVLEQPVDLPSRAQFASTAEIDAAPALVIVGYGLDETGDFGYRQVGTVFIGANSYERYGCYPYELVAGAQAVDACQGDSGGGCFVPCVDEQDRLVYKLGAVVSRSYHGASTCGSGGIKVRADRKIFGEGLAPDGWARTWLSQNGGILPGN